MYMKHIRNKITIVFLSALFLCPLVSCEDWFGIVPDSDMVLEDFWKKKADVLSGIGACYRAMNEDAFMRRLIVWGEVRSDNMIPGKSTEDNLSYMLSANINASNEYARWGCFYTVINYCNTVIKYAPQVMEVDPDFSQTELDSYIAEAKAIRAFCYFTLVRTFKSVPYIEEAYYDDSRPFLKEQSTDEEVLKALMADLEATANSLPLTYANDLYTRGRITRKAVWALMADIALWQNDYKRCIEYCDEVISNTENPLALERTSTYFRSVFFNGNSDESIWELQFDNYTSNSALNDLYGSSNNDAKLSSYDYRTTGTSQLFTSDDVRARNAFVEKDGFIMIKKYIAYLPNQNIETVREADFIYGTGINNWIVYRLPDIYLMKAEALVELGGGENLQQAIELVAYSYDRANPDLEPGSLVGRYSSQEQLRNLVFDERQREFLYEGKRYFDLVRRMRREGTPSDVINTYLISKYIAMNLDRNTVISKLNDVDAIYMPIHNDEIKVNTLLKQNRFYEVSKDITK